MLQPRAACCRGCAGRRGRCPPAHLDPGALTAASAAALHCPQGMPTDKAKLAFVKAYYEFLPKSLYSDSR